MTEAELRRRALELLSRRAYTEAALAERLLQAVRRQGGEPQAECCRRVVRALAADGFLDDAEYARAWLAARRSKLWGRERKRLELLRRGVPGALAQAALDEEAEAGVEREAAVAALDRRIRRFAARGRAVDPSRWPDYLRRLGFTSGAIREAVDLHRRRFLDVDIFGG